MLKDLGLISLRRTEKNKSSNFDKNCRSIRELTALGPGKSSLDDYIGQKQAVTVTAWL